MNKKYFSKTGIMIISGLSLLLLIPIGILFQNPLAIAVVNSIDSYQCKFVTTRPYSYNGPTVENCHWQWQCQFIDNSLGQNLCYMDIADNNNDNKICENIDNESLKKACLKRIQTE